MDAVGGVARDSGWVMFTIEPRSRQAWVSLCGCTCTCICAANANSEDDRAQGSMIRAPLLSLTVQDALRLSSDMSTVLVLGRVFASGRRRWICPLPLATGSPDGCALS